MGKLVMALAGIVLTATATGCHRDPEGMKVGDGVAVARVADVFLTVDEVKGVIPAGTSSADSLSIAKAYIRNWVEEQLVGNIAARNIPDMTEIDKMVKEYRNQLIMWEYRRRMYEENASEQTFPREAVDAYYVRHRDELKLERPIVKGIYLKVPDDNENLAAIKRLYRSRRTEDIDKLEKLLSGVIAYDHFRERWVDWSQIEQRIPLPELDADPDAYLRSHDHIETSVDGFTYLLDVTEKIDAGQTMPIDYARAFITDALRRENRLNYDRQLIRQLYDDALEDGEVEIAE